MDTTVLSFLNTHNISVLSILTPDNTIHSATLHYAHSENPLTFFFITEKGSRKCEGLLDGKEHTASLVIGFSEEEFKTFQMEGSVMIVSDTRDLEEAWNVYTSKYPARSDRKDNKSVVILKFVSTFGKYSNYKTDPPTKISL